MLTPSLNTVMTRLLIVAAVLGTIVFFAPAIFAQESGTIQYTENGTDPVRTFVSADPEGAGIDWDLTGHDADSFIIDSSGMLMFKKSPNYESPGDKPDDFNNDGDYCDYSYFDSDGNLQDGQDSRNVAPVADTGNCPSIPTPANANDIVYRSERPDNFYSIRVRATEKDGDTNRALSNGQNFTVEVVNANEPGAVTLDWIQPEVGTSITGTVSDPDKGLTMVKLEWYVSKVSDPDKDDDGHWTSVQVVPSDDTESPQVDIDSATTTSSYVPQGDCADDKNEGGTDAPNQGCEEGDDDTARDEGKYLRLVATYTDGHSV